jgi:hypothetical protein
VRVTTSMAAANSGSNWPPRRASSSSTSISRLTVSAKSRSVLANKGRRRAAIARDAGIRPVGSTIAIHDEWMRNVITNYGGGAAIQSYAARTRHQMDAIFPDALVDGFQALMAGLSLPDPKDRHVLAAAIHAGAAVIVTYNMRHFPLLELRKFGIEAWHPDEFVEFLLNAELDSALDAIHELRARLRRPPKSQSDYIDMLMNKLQMRWGQRRPDLAHSRRGERRGLR